MNYKLANYFDPNDNNLYIKLLNKIKEKFNLNNNNISIYELDDINNERMDMDDMDDIKDAFDEHEDENNFVLNLYIDINKNDNDNTLYLEENNNINNNKIDDLQKLKRRRFQHEMQKELDNCTESEPCQTR